MYRDKTTDLIKSDNCMLLRIIKLHNFVANLSVRVVLYISEKTLEKRVLYVTNNLYTNRLQGMLVIGILKSKVYKCFIK